MNYEEKYKEALEKARKELNTCGSQDCDAVRQIFRLFPELAESEDEKVRKALLEMVHDTTGDELLVDYNVHKEEALAWLEKQGEKLPVGFYYVNSEGKKFYSDTFKYGDVILHVEKQGEQKPQRMISAEAKEAMYDKPAWSEEDVRVIDDIFYSINEESVIEGLNDRGIMYALKDIRGIVKYLRNWLQDLKRRVQPQPKQEWSEEDESILQGIWDEILANKHDAKECEWKTYDKFLNWLKSLRPQNHWKPSDEQIAQLQIVIDTYGNEGICDPILTELLFQLKKLRGKV